MSATILTDTNFPDQEEESIYLDEIPDTGGVRLAVKGEKVPRGYVVMYNLRERNGRICQKAVRQAENKMVAGAANK